MKGYFLLLLVVLSSVTAEELYSYNYPGRQVVRVSLESQKQVDFLQSLDLDVWSRDSTLGLGENDVLVNKIHIEQLESAALNFSVLIPDLEILMIREKEEMSRAQEVGASFHDSYHSFAEIIAFLRNLTAVYPKLITYVPSIGKSIENRDIPAVRITGTATGAKKKIFFNSLQHAREWVSGATVLYMIDQLVSLYGKDNTVTNIMNKVEFVVVPVVNPDGYEFSRTGTRLWRKNRRLNSGSIYGVDLNRNWDDHWGGEGSSKNPSSDTYCGTKAFSEPETIALSNFIRSEKPNGYIDYHCYSQLILRPFGWTKTPPDDEKVLKQVGDTMRDLIKANGGKTYTSEPAYTLYFTTGSADDWSYSQAGVKFVYTFELRDTGTYGFQLPANQIIPTGIENWAAFKFYAEYIANAV